MLRHASFAVLAFLILLTAIPASAATVGQPGCPDGSLAAIFNTPGETGEEAVFPTQDDPQNKTCIFICEPWGLYTSYYRGTGSDCQAARTSLINQIGSEAVSTGGTRCDNAGAALGYCGWVLNVTVSCHWDFVLGTYVEDGRGDIKCKDYC